MHTTSVVAGAALLGLLSQTATAAVWGFGDSNIDSGWFTTAPYSGEPKFDTYLSQAALYGVGRQTNNPGPMSIEVLAATLGGTALPGNRPGGTNFATSGAKNVMSNRTADGFPNAIPTVTQINNFLATHQVATPDVFLIDSGANDINTAVTLTLTEQRVYLQNQAMALANAIHLLQAHGAAHIIVTNQPEDFGETKDRDARQIYDAALRASLDAAKVTYLWGDRNDVRHRIVANPSQFNMMFTDTATTHIACPDGQVTFQNDWALVCSANVPGDMPGAFAQNTLFADNGHWASNGQRALGAYYICLVRANWPGLVPPLAPPQPFPCGSFGITLPSPPLGPPIIVGGKP